MDGYARLLSLSIREYKYLFQGLILAHWMNFKLGWVLVGHSSSLCYIFAPAFLVDSTNFWPKVLWVGWNSKQWQGCLGKCGTSGNKWKNGWDRYAYVAWRMRSLYSRLMWKILHKFVQKNLKLDPAVQRLLRGSWLKIGQGGNSELMGTS